MSRYLRSTCLLTLLSAFLPLSLYAATELTIDYNLDVEINSEEDDEVVSEFSSVLIGNHIGRVFEVNYDLTADYVYEHEESEDNILTEGEFDSQYNVTPYLVGLFDLNLVELSTAGDDGFDRLETATLVEATTGLSYVLNNFVRGSLSFSRLRTVFHFEDSPLDAVEDSFVTRYRRPINQSIDIVLSHTIARQRYDEDAQSINDVDSEQIRIEFIKRLSSFDYNIYLEKNYSELINQPSSDEEELNAYGLAINYSINSSSSLIFNYAKEVEQVFQLNANLLDPQNPLSNTGLVENTSASILYTLIKDNNNFSARIYDIDINNISQPNINSGGLSGVFLSYERLITQKWTFDIRYNQFENETNNNEFDRTTVTISYLISQSARYSNTVRFATQRGTDNDGDTENEALIYQFTANLY